MLSTVLLDLQHLDKKMLQACQELLPKEIWIALEGKDPWGIEIAQIYGILALDNNGATAGLALCSFYPSLSYARLLSVSLQNKYQEKTFYLQLFTSMEALLAEHGCQSIEFIYSDQNSNLDMYKEVFQDLKWGKQALLLVRFHFGVQIFDAPWYHRLIAAKLPTDYDIFPWVALQPHEREELLIKLEQGSFPRTVSPFYQELTIEPTTSLGLRYQGKLIGWMINHLIEPDTVSFTSFYIDVEFRGSKAPFCLLASSISLLKQTSISKALVELNLSHVNKDWLSFAKNKLAPHAKQVERLFNISKKIS